MMNNIDQDKNISKKHHKGWLIAMEGGDGGGKTTQIALLKERFVATGRQVIVVHEPGGTAIGEQIRQVVLSNKNMEMCDQAEVLLYQASRAQLYKEVIIPALAEDKVVLMDRTSYSSLVYQGMVRGMGTDLIRSFNDFSTQEVEPDLTFLLDVSAEIGLSRIKPEQKDRLELQGQEFHQKVRKGYLDLANQIIKTNTVWKVIDAVQAVSNVQNIIWEAVEILLKNTIEKSDKS